MLRDIDCGSQELPVIYLTTAIVVQLLDYLVELLLVHLNPLLLESSLQL